MLRATMKTPGAQTLALATAYALASALGVACVRAAQSPGKPEAPRPPIESASSTAPVRDAPLAFIENDYAGALAQARDRHLPLFIDAWAPWCHTCLSMRSFVFVDPSVRALGDRFVWLALDTEREENAAFVSARGLRTLPTLYVVDPATERAIVAWPGSLMPNELESLLEDAAAAMKQPGSRQELAGDAATALLRGHRARAEGQLDDAVTAYRAAIAASPPNWPKRAEAVDALVTCLADRGQRGACVTTAADEAPRLPPGTALADVLRAALGCADDLPSGAPERARLVDLVAQGEGVASDRSQPILADDRSDLYDYLVHAQRELAHGDDAKRLARAWVTFLEEESSRATTPAARAVFDAHRLVAYAAVGDPLRAVPMLERSERDFPNDYNPPARLARVYLETRRYAEALAATKRALDRAYGPRKLRLWALQADVYEALGETASARSALRDALDFARAEPLTGGYRELRASLEKRLAALR